ncbi:hypothetical protein Nepgr_016899 [Nepenthes gracilis]|uniref:BHLH domain-containing protein n=1 Tax=Nepenthes gracilis TaxID=150966 RepID=A0AAD3XS05_NEPGR|nr:hypothetical protein Nepgr_016899 [Nepenthes gracilis]
MRQGAANGNSWMEGEEEDGAVSRSRTGDNNNNNEAAAAANAPPKHDAAMNAALSTFKSNLENDWLMSTGNTVTSPLPSYNDLPNTISNPEDFKDIVDNLLLQATLDSSSCSQSPAFTLDPLQPHRFLPSKSSLSSLLDVASTNPFDNAFNYAYDPGFLTPIQSANNSMLINFAANEMGAQLPSSNSEFPALGTAFNSVGFESFEGSLSPQFLNRCKALRPLEIIPSVGAETTLFPKRAMVLGGGSVGEDSGFSDVGIFEIPGVSEGNWGKREMDCQLGEKRRRIEGDEVGEGSLDVLGFNFDSDEGNEINRVGECRNNEGTNVNSNTNSLVTGGGGDQKGKKKGFPAKNLLAERRRRKKLNDRLYMLRSVVPKISKMDRASILGDAVEYLKELLQRINDLHSELESTHPGSSMPTSSFHPLTPSPSTLPCRVKEELCQNSLSSPKSQPARVEVRAREGRAVNIHMFCARRPGLLLSTIRALDNLGLDIQQAVISCFNGFALDVFRAEQCREGLDILPEQIKAVLLDSAGFHGVI